MKKRIFFIVLALAMLLTGFAFTADAKTESLNDFVFNIDTGFESVIPATHESVQNVDFIDGYFPKGEDGDEGFLNNPQDLFIDRENNIYIADTGNNAVVKLDKDGNFVLAITEESGIKYPLGVFVDDTQDIFVADNGNKRVVHFDKDGNYVEEFVAPESELLSQNLTDFDPTKIAINDYNGYIYLLIGKEFLTLDAKNQFKGLVGTEPVGFDLADYLTRLFATDEQLAQLKKREPVSYNNFCITYDNEIFAVSSAQQNQIKKINSSGDSLYPDGQYAEMSLDSETGEMVSPFLVDIAVNSHEMITVADQRTSKLYQYNIDGELLAVFGGEAGDSISRGRFKNISSICYNTNDELWVLDAESNSLQKLRTTAFMQAVHEGITLYREGRYEESLATWDTISQLVSCYPAAQTSIANIYFKQERFEDAQAEYKEARNREGYAKAFGEIRDDFLVVNFGWVVPLGIVIVAAVLFLALYARRYCMLLEEDMFRKDITRFHEFRAMTQLALFHPLQTWDLLKWRRFRQNWLPAIVMPILTILVRFLASSCTAYTVSTMESYQVSFWYEVLLVLLPYLTFGFALFKITSVFSGEMTLCETFSSLGYSLFPMVLIWPPMTAISYIVAENEIAIFNLVQIVVYIWVLINIVGAIQRINDVSLGRAIALTLLSVLFTVIVWALCILIYIFTAQIVFFVNDLWAEIMGRLYGL